MALAHWLPRAIERLQRSIPLPASMNVFDASPDQFPHGAFEIGAGVRVGESLLEAATLLEALGATVARP